MTAFKSAVDRRFDTVDNRFDAIEQLVTRRLDGLDAKLDECLGQMRGKRG